MVERGFVPPVARRKVMARDRYRRLQSRRNSLTACLLAVGALSLIVVNLSFMQSDETSTSTTSFQRHLDASLRGKAWISINSQPFNEENRARNAHHLILVAGHSVTVSGHLEDADVDEADWFLLDYQKGQGLPQAIRAHIEAGINEANQDPDSLLIFSGGETRAVTGPLTEGSSYFHVADAMKLWPKGGSVRARTVTEEFATDSFENLLFSICRFKEITGAYPTKITTVSFSFKQHRFEALHAPALGWPAERFSYIGVDPSESTGFDLARSREGELKNAAAPFETDPYGCHSPVLQKKRKDRNPFSRTPPYPLSCPDMADLFHYCGPSFFPVSQLPWGV